MGEQTFFGSATVGERGQIAIPAEARRTYGLEPGDKVLFFSTPFGKGGLLMMKAEELGKLIERLSGKAQNLEQIMKENREEVTS